MGNKFYLKLFTAGFVFGLCLFATPVFAESNWCNCVYHAIGAPDAELNWFAPNSSGDAPLLGTEQTIKLVQDGELKVTVNDFDEECFSVATSLKAAFGANLTYAKCSLYTCEKGKDECTFDEESEDAYKKKEGNIKWTIAPPNEEVTPIKVDLGESTKVEITVTDAENIKFGLEKPGVGFSIKSSGKTATVTLDTNKTDTVDPAMGDITGLRQVEVYAVDEDNQSDQLNRDLYFFVKVNCGKQIAGLSCKTPEELNNCETKCNNEYCKMEDTACVKKVFGDTGAPADTAAPAAPAVDMKEYLKGQYRVPEGYEKRGGVLPTCAFSGTCRKTNDLVELLVNFGKAMFAIMGSFAFAFFVYGGFTMIVSMGNAEKQKKGQQILAAAVIGIVIAFSAYMLINFMLEALDVDPTFRGIKSN